MAIFEDITLDFQGVTYSLSGDGQIMKAIAAIEDHVTISELTEGSQTGKLPLAKLASAFAAVLRQAGARVSDAEVYADMWRGGGDIDKITEAITSLLTMMMPPETMRELNASDAEGDADNGEGKATPE